MRIFANAFASAMEEQLIANGNFKVEDVIGVAVAGKDSLCVAHCPVVTPKLFKDHLAVGKRELKECTVKISDAVATPVRVRVLNRFGCWCWRGCGADADAERGAESASSLRAVYHRRGK